MAWSVVVAAVSALLASFGMFVESSLRVWRTTIHHSGRAKKQVNSEGKSGIESDDGSGATGAVVTKPANLDHHYEDRSIKPAIPPAAIFAGSPKPTG